MHMINSSIARAHVRCAVDVLPSETHSVTTQEACFLLFAFEDFVVRVLFLRDEVRSLCLAKSMIASLYPLSRH